MNIKIKPLLYIFISVLIIFTLLGVVLNNTYLPIKQNKVFDQLENSVVKVPEDINEEQQEIHFTLDKGTQLPAAVQELNKVIENSEYVDYKLVLNSDNESQVLADTWQQLQYDFYEIIGQKKFTELPTLPIEFSKQYPNINFSVSMDEQFVYITLDDQENQLYRMLPLKTTDVRTWG